MPEIKRIEPGRRFSEAVVCDGVVYISGQVDLARNRDPKVQTAEVLKTIDDLLAKAGSDKEHILRCTDRKSTRLNSSHKHRSRMPSSA